MLLSDLLFVLGESMLGAACAALIVLLVHEFRQAPRVASRCAASHDDRGVIAWNGRSPRRRSGSRLRAMSPVCVSRARL
jgi:hypothetical protein